MKEQVGSCSECGKSVYCLEGFLNGVIEEGRLYCFTCADQEADD
ncbi:hypothetical protein [Aquibacillus sediminis]|nr:hypothetical protein [Aquibacillus sediminis]